MSEAEAPPPDLLRTWGIEPSYEAIGGRRVDIQPETARSLLRAMGAEGPPAPPPAVLVHPAGRPLGLDEPHEVETEDRARVPAPGALPSDVPPGYHTLRRLRDGQATRLIVTPASCHVPPELRAWAWAVQLYATRSRDSWGMGDLADLHALGRWARELGAGALLVNPLHAPLPGHPQEPSPYFPSSRLYRNPLYLRIEDVPGAGALGDRLGALAGAGRELLRARRLDRDRVLDLKLEALEALFASFQGDPEFDAYQEREGKTLEAFATFCVLCERHGRRWRGWPPGLRHPAGAEVRAFAGRHRDRVRFHAWLQWHLDRQLAAAASELAPIHDLAVGVDPDGADAWLFQDVLAEGVSVGAPPDPFAAEGQDWSVPPFDPWRLRRAGYEPFVRTLRASLRHGLGLRIDHVMGLFRLFWIPEGLGPAAGAYVRYPHRELLGLVALESRRAGALVVGEDLGTVEADVLAELERHRVLSYRLLWFEERPPGEYPAEALAALTTHDLPTLAGIWEGADPDAGIRDRLRRHGRVPDGAPVVEAARAAYRTLAASPCRLVAATLEDALGVVDRPNRPGTGDPDNWSLALPVALPELLEDPRPRELARWLQRPPASADPE